MSIIGTIYEDITTEVLGVIGSWQWLVTFITMVCMICPTMNQYEDAFLLEPQRMTECIKPKIKDITNSTLCMVRNKNGTIDVKCTKWHTNFLGLFWIKKSWLMFCTPEIKILSTSIISRLGSIFGCVIFGVISDSFGRKLSMKLSVTVEMVFRAIMIFVDSESWFHLLIFLRSLFASGNTYMGIVLICEIASNEWRTQLTAIALLPRVLAAICLMSIANLVPTTETFDFIACLCCALNLILLRKLKFARLTLTVHPLSCLLVLITLPKLPHLVSVGVLSKTKQYFMPAHSLQLISGRRLPSTSSFRWLPESPQWLLYNGKISSTEKLLTKAAKRNGITLGSIFKIRPVNYKAYIVLDETRTCLGILTTYNIRILTITTAAFWCLYYFIWCSMYLRVFYNAIERNIILKLLCLVLGMSFLNISLIKKLNLRKLLVINLMIIVLLETLLMIFQQLMIQETITNLISLLALSTGVIVQVLILNITPRLLAINIRATLFGFCHSAGQLGAIVCYIVVLLNAIDNISLMITNVTLAITLVFLCHILPDVDGREIPDVLEDMDYFSELSKPLRWAAQKLSSPSHEEREMRVYSFNSAVQNFSTKSHSTEQLPARRIGFVQNWRSVFELFKFCRK